MRFWQLRVGPMKNFAYLVAGDAGDEAFLVDPGFEPERLVAFAMEQGLRITHVLATHGHPDHIAGVADVVVRTGARVVGHASADHPVEVPVKDGETLRIAGVDVRIVHAPGHRFDAVCFLLDGTHLLTGDTLFVGDCGRVDLPGSDVRAMHQTLLTTLAALPGALVVAPGHDYGARPLSTLEEERRTNPTLRPRDLAAFQAFMREA